ncbi:MAG: C4-dicarboxylate TRAP transporter substrate-binding protein [Planctomycetes bacterium]|nr:C4-dicarboxylate TRAP transporter substrate-binding protein [Planctomycetota bacterium]
MQRIGTTLLVALSLTIFAAAPVVAAEYTIKIGYENHPGEPLDTAVRLWKEKAEEKAGGRLEVQLFPSSQLGSKKDLIEQMRMGANVVTITDGAFLADYIPDMAIVMGPYLADTIEDIFVLLESPWWKDLEAQLEPKGLRVVTYNFLYGVRNMVTKNPVNSIEDLAGMKIRVPNNKIQVEAVKAMGAIPTPMPLAEVYPALTQGVIDGAENPIPVLYGQKHHEAAKNLIMTRHLDNIACFVGSSAYFGKLPPEVRAAFEEAAHEAGVYSQQLAKDVDDETVAKMRAAGVTVYEPDLKPFQEATKSVYSQFPEWSPGLYEKAREIMYGGK